MVVTAWQRSHAVHHARTNHVTEGETHVPTVVDARAGEAAGGEADLAISRKIGHRRHSYAGGGVLAVECWRRSAGGGVLATECWR